MQQSLAILQDPLHILRPRGMDTKNFDDENRKSKLRNGILFLLVKMIQFYSKK